MAVRLAELLAKVPDHVEARVRAARDQMRPVVQEHLRSETRLAFRTIEDNESRRAGGQVAVEIAAGHPACLAAVEFGDDFELALMLSQFRSALVQIQIGARGVAPLNAQLPATFRLTPPVDFASVERWAKRLLHYIDHNDPATKVLGVSEDIMGVYWTEPLALRGDEHCANPAGIRLYWAVIGLVSDWLGVAVEDLTTVVLTHELAHAYTQLGADISGRRWPVQSFWSASVDVKEGLAQYYTSRCLDRLRRRTTNPLEVYKRLLKYQPGPYQVQARWVGVAPEAVRRALIEFRSWNDQSLEHFEDRLAAAQEGLMGGKWAPDESAGRVDRPSGPDAGAWDSLGNFDG